MLLKNIPGTFNIKDMPILFEGLILKRQYEEKNYFQDVYNKVPKPHT